VKMGAISGEEKGKRDVGSEMDSEKWREGLGVKMGGVVKRG